MTRSKRTRYVVAFITIFGIAMMSTSPAGAWTTTKQSGSYTVETRAQDPQPEIRFLAYQKWYYTPYSNRFTVDWNDLRIDVYSTGTLDAAPMQFFRANTSQQWGAYSGCLPNDTVPSTFYYNNTPAWAEVPVNAETFEGDYFYRYIGDEWWSSGQPISHYQRASGFGAGDEVCGAFGYWDKTAGINMHYSPYIGGWNWSSYSPGS